MRKIKEKRKKSLSLNHNPFSFVTFAPKLITKDMKIGDKVRFLNEVGGGIVKGFQGKDIVLVEDLDGFAVPMLRSQVVVIETNANNFEVKKKEEAPKPRVRFLEDGVDDDPSARPTTFQPKPQERKGGDLLNVCLAFVPENSRELSTTRFEAYIVNDSNYYVNVVFANNEGAAWHLRWQGLLEPNTKQLVDTFERSSLNDLERLSVQLIAWKQDKPYMLKPAVGVELRLDVVKFYKLHVFQPSPFFREPALVYDIVRDDRPIRQIFVEPESVRDALRSNTLTAEEPDDRPTNDDVEPVLPHPNNRFDDDTPIIPQRTREEEREALKAAKRQLKAEQQARAKEMAAKAEQQALKAKELAAMAEQQRRSRQMAAPPKDLIEVDLHINALLDNTEGLSPTVLLNTQLTEFRIMMERNIRRKGLRIVFIHDKNDDVLREALIKELTRRYRTCTYEDAPFQKYAFGATMVTIL